MADLGLDASGCTDKRDIVEKIARHPGGLAAAAVAAATASGDVVARRDDSQRGPGGDGEIAVGGSDDGRGGGDGGGGDDGGGDNGGGDGGKERDDATTASEPQEEGENLVGMTLADYMSRPPVVDDDPGIAETGRGEGRSRGGHGADGGDGRGGGRAALSPSGSVNGGRPCSTSAGSAAFRVRLAPAHIAPPSQPAPEWVLTMQVCGFFHQLECFIIHHQRSALHCTQEESLLFVYMEITLRMPSKGRCSSTSRCADVRGDDALGVVCFGLIVYR